MANNNFIDEFLIGLGFKFEGEDGERFKKQTEVVASTITKVTMAAVAATAALYAMSKSSADQNYELSKTATMLDTTVDSINRWRHAFDLAGVGGENVVGMLAKLQEQAQQATRTGSGPFRAYAELGVDFEALASGALDVSDALDQILARAQQMDRQTAKGALRELGIDERLLDTSIERMRAAGDEADRWGRNTEKLTALSADFAEAQDDLKLRFEGVSNMVAERALPTMIKFFEALTEGLEWLQTTGFPIMDEFAEKMGGWDKVLTALGLVALPGLIKGLGSVLRLVTGIGGGAATAGSALAMMARGGALAFAGYAGWKAGEQINEALPQDVKDFIGESIAKALAFLGNEDARQAVEINTGESFKTASEVISEGRKRRLDAYYAKHPNERPKLQNKPTVDEWLAAPPGTYAQEPDWPVAEADTPAARPEGMVTPEMLHTPARPRGPGDGPGATINSNNQTTNYFQGVPLSEVENLFNEAERRESLNMQHENASPIVR